MEVYASNDLHAAIIDDIDHAGLKIMLSRVIPAKFVRPNICEVSVSHLDRPWPTRVV